MVRRKKRSQAQNLKPWQREAFWRSHISGWKCSGQNKKEYCLENRLTQSTFQYWLRAIQGKDDQEEALLNPQPALFKRLELVNIPTSQDANSIVNAQMEQAIEPQVNANSLSSVVERLEKTHVEITFPNGIVLRTDDCCRVEFLAGLFQGLKESNRDQY